MLEEYKKFALRGNVVDMAIGIIIGAAFNGVVQSLVKDVLTPPLGLLVGDVDFSNLFLVVQEGATPGPYPTLEAAQTAGAVTINGGVFLNTLVSFLIVSFAVFMLVRSVNRMTDPEVTPEPAAPTVKKCPYCVQDIAIQATRCPHCTSEIEDAPAVEESA